MNKSFKTPDNTEYIIEEDLTGAYPEKKYKTYTATTDSDPCPVIIKEMDEKRAQIYTSLTGIQNKYIAKVYDVHKVNDPNGSSPFYIAVTECAGHCDENNEEPTLSHYIHKHGPLCKDTALRFAMQICDALISIHDKNIVHRDLKPDNIIVSDETENFMPVLKLIDFGISGNGENPYESTIIKTHIEDAGTVGYSPYDKMLTPRWDIYSLGCILNYMLTGHTPDMHLYSDDFEIRRIIEKCTDEYSRRYINAKSLYNELSHSARIRLWDRIPILRSIPGYRSHTLWKSTIATICYALLFYLGIDIIKHRGIDTTFTIFVISWFFLPVMIIFDPMYLCYRIDYSA